MKLSLSVRIVESACKTRLHIPFQELVSVAKSSGYDVICMRASAVGVDSPTATLASLRAIVKDAGLKVSMVTADVNVPLNNVQGPDSLRNIGPSLDVAETLGCNLIRVCLKRHEDIAYAKTAADQAAKRDIRLAHQCHTATLFEEVDSSRPDRNRSLQLWCDLRAGQPAVVWAALCGGHLDEATAVPDECLRAKPST